jgi:DNA-binding transcriptional ArsR family regulator
MGAVKQRDEGSKPGARSGPAWRKDERQRFEVLHHPWRIRILDVLAERDMSVAQFVDEGFIPELRSVDRKIAISKLAYHFRELRRAGAIQVVEENPRRGSTELVCRADARAFFSDEQWATLPAQKRQALSRFILHEFMARAESALQQGTFDARVDRHLAWLAMEVDEQGWSEIAALLNGVLETVSEIGRESQERLQRSGEPPIRATFGQLNFESPPLRGPLGG